MALLSILYPHQPGAKFDESDYFGRHLPLVHQRWAPMGLTDIRVVRGVGTPDESLPSYQLMAFVSFSSLQALRSALSTHSDEIFASIRRFTDIRPVVQISEELPVAGRSGEEFALRQPR